MKAKKLIEVAMPIKEISAESLRDKSIRHGHISTLHLWWARRPLPACRAVVFASLVPDPEDPACPLAFKDAIAYLLKNENPNTEMMYRPYKDIPYTAIVDEMEDTLRHRLMMFIGKFSDKCQENMIAGKSTSPKEQLSDGSLIKWENKTNTAILNKARELIFVAYNSESSQDYSFESLHREFKELASAITDAENALYSVVNRHLSSAETEHLEQNLHDAIESFQNRMPSVFDPFAGGGAIPLEAARLGCRSYGNDINPVAHIIERGSAEFPQKYGKPITYSEDEFSHMYGERGRKMLREHELAFIQGKVEIPNRLAWDVEYYAKQILEATEDKIGYLYPKDEKGRKPIAYYWTRTAKCSNPSCGAEVPLMKGFYIANTSSKKIYFKPVINGSTIDFELKNGKSTDKPWNHRGNMTCPCCGTVTNVDDVKSQSVDHHLPCRPMAIIFDGDNGKEYRIPTEEEQAIITAKVPESERPTELLPLGYNQAFPVCLWGYSRWGEIFTDRQIYMLNTLLEQFYQSTSVLPDGDYSKALITYLAIWIDRIAIANTAFGVYHTGGEKLERILGRQSISMNFDFPESNPFCGKSGSALNQLEWITRYINTESDSQFTASFLNASSGDKLQFEKKSISAVVTDPPYYDAIGYADCSDFFYVWLKRTLSATYPMIFSTPQTPKMEECTAIKHHHDNDEEKAKRHFEKKLTEIFDAIEEQTNEIVSIMFAHQSTEAWTTLCNSILGARMNITGSWPMDTEMQGALKTGMAFLESSVTVACRPNERKGYEEFKEVEKSIKKKVEEEVEKLYELGFRGADLLTACFGQAVSEFGKYKVVEKANGDRVTVAELLDMARQTAFDTLLKGIKADELTRFYIGWLQMNGMAETNHDDVTKFTRVGVNVDIHEVIQEGLLVSNGNKNHLASAEEHLGTGRSQGTQPDHPLIDQVHRAMLLNRKQDNEGLLKLIRDCAQSSDAQFWRLLASLKETLPAGKDLTDVQELLRTADYLRAKSKETIAPQQISISFDE